MLSLRMMTGNHILNNGKKASSILNQKEIDNHKNSGLENGNINSNGQSINAQSVAMTSGAKRSKIADNSAKLDDKGLNPVFFATAILFCFVILAITINNTNAEGWTTYRHDSARSGITDEKLSAPLALNWVFKPNHAPIPAWPEPAEEIPRSHFDNAYHVTIANGNAYFGSSVDNKVYALDMPTGDVKWAFFTEGPVRFAPTAWKDRIYFGSDDGFVYCLRADNGKPLWKYRAGPSDEKVVGNGRMIADLKNTFIS